MLPTEINDFGDDITGVDATITVDVTLSTDITISTDASVSTVKNNFEFDIHVIMYFVIGCVGVMDNGLVVLVIGRSAKMIKRSYNLLILNQSVIDMLASIFLICNSPPMKAIPAPQPGLAAQVFCKLWSNSFWLWLFLQLSAANLWLVTVERYIGIVHPLVHKRYVTTGNVLRIILSFYVLFFIFQLIVGAIPSYADDSGVCHHFVWSSTEAQAVVGMLCYLLAFVIPVLTMVYCYAKMIISIRTKIGDQPQSIAEERRAVKMAKVRKNLVKTLIAVCVAFTVCLVFNQTFFMLVNFNLNLPFGTPFYHFTVYIQFLNSVINPFIYVFYYKEFQATLLKMLNCCFVQNITSQDTANGDDTN